jgi:hypothetical protein
MRACDANATLPYTIAHHLRQWRDDIDRQGEQRALWRAAPLFPGKRAIPIRL